MISLRVYEPKLANTNRMQNPLDFLKQALSSIKLYTLLATVIF